MALRLKRHSELTRGVLEANSSVNFCQLNGRQDAR